MIDGNLCLCYNEYAKRLQTNQVINSILKFFYFKEDICLRQVKEFGCLFY